MSPAPSLSPATVFRAGLHFRVHAAVEARAVYTPGLGLVVVVDALPTGLFGVDYLLGGPEVGRRLLTPEGEATWNKLHAFAQHCVAKHGAPDDIAAVLLAPSAAATARARLKMQRAA